MAWVGLFALALTGLGSPQPPFGIDGGGRHDDVHMRMVSSRREWVCSTEIAPALPLSCASLWANVFNVS